MQRIFPVEIIDTILIALQSVINLAPIRFNKIESTPTSPICSLSHSPLNIAGRALHQVNACLSPRLKQLDGPGRQLFGNVDGTGTHATRLVATHLAISEALERWAWEELLQSGKGDAFGFGLDPTTSGMAAFPGLVARQARPHALWEAVERWCIREWWEGRLPCARIELSEPGQASIRIGNPLSRHRVVVSWASDASGLVAYGVGCGYKAAAAAWRARIEQDRMDRALRRYNKEHGIPDTNTLSGIRSYAERSFLYFALSEGHAEFLQCLDQSAVMEDILNSATGKRQLQPVVDSSIPGPWSRYAHVWRVLYPSQETNSSPYSFYN